MSVFPCHVSHISFEKDLQLRFFRSNQLDAPFKVYCYASKPWHTLISNSWSMCIPSPYRCRFALHVAHARIQLRVDEEQRRERRFGPRPAEIFKVATGPLNVLSGTNNGAFVEKNGVYPAPVYHCICHILPGQLQMVIFSIVYTIMFYYDILLVIVCCSYR